jgi:hypothetical protein
MKTAILIIASALMFVAPTGILPVVFWGSLILMFLRVAGRNTVRNSSIEGAGDPTGDARQSVGVATKGNGQSDGVLVIRRIAKSSYGLWDCFRARPFL